MRNALLLAALAAAVSPPIAAQPATGMAAMQYYVGNWNCISSAVGEAPDKATSSFTLESELLRQTVVVPPQGKMKTSYILNIATTYDAKNGRYVQTGLDNTAAWWISYAKPWSGTYRRVGGPRQFERQAGSRLDRTEPEQLHDHRLRDDDRRKTEL